MAWRPLRLVALAYLLIVLAMMLLENWLIFIPTRYPGGYWQPQRLVWEDAWIDTPDGLRLHGWYVPHPEPIAHVLFCHGNAGNVTHRADILRVLHEVVGVSVLIFDYRGYGRSPGRPNETGILADASAAHAWLAQRAGVSPDRIVVLGESIGGAVAVDVAAGRGARALILESTFNSLPDLAARLYPWLPVRWLMRTRLDSESKIGQYRGPLLQSHGDPDTIVPFDLGRRLFEAANEPKEFLRLPGVDHNDQRPREYYAAMRRFLERLD